VSRTRAWLKLGGAVVAVALGVALLHVASPHVGGAFGRAYDNNTRRDIDARALFYTEVGAVSEFLDVDGGRYGDPGQIQPRRVESAEEPVVPR